MRPIRKRQEAVDSPSHKITKQANTTTRNKSPTIILLLNTMTFESLYRVTTQSLSDSCAMYKAEASVHMIIDTFGKKYLDIDVLWPIQNMMSLHSYDCALWSLMDAFQEEYIVEDNDELLMLLEEAWKSISQYQEGRVLSFKESQKEGETNAQESTDRLVNDVEKIIESCELGMQRVSEYRHGSMHYS